MNTNYYLPALHLIKKKFKIILSVIFLYLFFLIINSPANIVLSMSNLASNIKITSVSGTIWSGEAKQFSYSGIEFGLVKWKLHPLNLIIGELSADVTITNREQYIKTQINLSASGQIELEETRFLIDLSSLQPLTYGMPFSYTGTAAGYFPVSFFYKNNHIGINGKLSLNNVALNSPQHQNFGDFIISFRAEKDGATSGKIKDSGGLISIDGEVLLNKNGQLTLSANLASRKKGGSLEKMLSFLGRKDSNGRTQINQSFKLWH